jgi:hypothetical protein
MAAYLNDDTQDADERPLNSDEEQILALFIAQKNQPSGKESDDD